jgi:hypothetical protein
MTGRSSVMRTLVLAILGVNVLFAAGTAQAQWPHYTVNWMGITWNNFWGDISVSAADTLLVTASQPVGMPLAGEAHYSAAAHPIGPAPWVSVTYNDPGFPADFAQLLKIRQNWGSSRFGEIYIGAYSNSYTGEAGYYAGWFDQPSGYQGTVYFGVPRTPGLHVFKIGQRPDGLIDFLLDEQVGYTLTGMQMDFQDISLRNESPAVTSAEFTSYSAGPGYSVPGDLNCDGLINAFDIDPFVLALTDATGYAAAFPSCDRMLADCNADGLVNAFDIDPFVLLLTGG